MPYSHYQGDESPGKRLAEGLMSRPNAEADHQSLLTTTSPTLKRRSQELAKMRGSAPALCIDIPPATTHGFPGPRSCNWEEAQQRRESNECDEGPSFDHAKQGSHTAPGPDDQEENAEADQDDSCNSGQETPEESKITRKKSSFRLSWKKRKRRKGILIRTAESLQEAALKEAEQIQRKQQSPKKPKKFFSSLRSRKKTKEDFQGKLEHAVDASRSSGNIPALFSPPKRQMSAANALQLATVTANDSNSSEQDGANTDNSQTATAHFTAASEIAKQQRRSNSTHGRRRKQSLLQRIASGDDGMCPGIADPKAPFQPSLGSCEPSSMRQSPECDDEEGGLDNSHSRDPSSLGESLESSFYDLPRVSRSLGEGLVLWHLHDESNDLSTVQLPSTTLASISQLELDAVRGYALEMLPALLPSIDSWTALQEPAKGQRSSISTIFKIFGGKAKGDRQPPTSNLDPSQAQSRKSSPRGRTRSSTSDSPHTSDSSAPRVFSRPLAELLHDDRIMLNSLDLQVPYIVKSTIDYIRQHGMTSEGIFRISGSSKRTRSLNEAFEAELRPNFEGCKPSDGASVLKYFLRQMTEPLILAHLQHAFLDVPLVVDAKNQLLALRLLCSLLPLEHQNLLAALLRLMKEISEHSDVNHMTKRNLALVLAPNIIRGASLGKDKKKLSRKTTDPKEIMLASESTQMEISKEERAAEVVELMIGFSDRLLQIPSSLRDDILLFHKDRNPNMVLMIVTGLVRAQNRGRNSSSHFASAPASALLRQAHTPRLPHSHQQHGFRAAAKSASVENTFAFSGPQFQKLLELEEGNNSRCAERDAKNDAAEKVGRDPRLSGGTEYANQLEPMQLCVNGSKGRIGDPLEFINDDEQVPGQLPVTKDKPAAYMDIVAAVGEHNLSIQLQEQQPQQQQQARKDDDDVGSVAHWDKNSHEGIQVYKQCEGAEPAGKLSSRHSSKELQAQAPVSMSHSRRVAPIIGLHFYPQQNQSYTKMLPPRLSSSSLSSAFDESTRPSSAASGRVNDTPARTSVLEEPQDGANNNNSNDNNKRSGSGSSTGDENGTENSTKDDLEKVEIKSAKKRSHESGIQEYFPHSTPISPSPYGSIDVTFPSQIGSMNSLASELSSASVYTSTSIPNSTSGEKPILSAVAVPPPPPPPRHHRPEQATDDKEAPTQIAENACEDTRRVVASEGGYMQCDKGNGRVAPVEEAHFVDQEGDPIIVTRRRSSSQLHALSRHSSRESFVENLRRRGTRETLLDTLAPHGVSNEDNGGEKRGHGSLIALEAIAEESAHSGRRGPSKKASSAAQHLLMQQSHDKAVDDAVTISSSSLSYPDDIAHDGATNSTLTTNANEADAARGQQALREVQRPARQSIKRAAAKTASLHPHKSNISAATTPRKLRRGSSAGLISLAKVENTSTV